MHAAVLSADALLQVCLFKESCRRLRKDAMNKRASRLPAYVYFTTHMLWWLSDDSNRHGVSILTSARLTGGSACGSIWLRSGRLCGHGYQASERRRTHSSSRRMLRISPMAGTRPNQIGLPSPTLAIQERAQMQRQQRKRASQCEIQSLHLLSRIEKRRTFCASSRRWRSAESASKGSAVKAKMARI